MFLHPRFVQHHSHTTLIHSSGDPVYKYKQLGYLNAVSAIDFHRHDNYIAFSSYGDGQPVYIYSYDPTGMIFKLLLPAGCVFSCG